MPKKKKRSEKHRNFCENAKPGSLTSKANLVNKYNSGVKTEEVIPRSRIIKRRSKLFAGKE